DPVDTGHAHVHEDDIGLLLADGVDAGRTVAGLTGHGHIGLGVDDHGEAGAHKGLVIDEDDAQRIRRMFAHRRPPFSPLGALAPEVAAGLPASSTLAAGPASCPAPSLSALPLSRPRAPMSWASVLASWASTPRLSGNRASTRKPVAVPKALLGTLPELNAGSPPDTLADPDAPAPPEGPEPPEAPEPPEVPAPSEESVSPAEWLARAVSVPPWRAARSFVPMIPWPRARSLPLWSFSGASPAPSSLMRTRSSRPSSCRLTCARAPLPACLSTFVSASCTIRYTASA